MTLMMTANAEDASTDMTYRQNAAELYYSQRAGNYQRFLCCE